jgi:hypothetical protein
MGAVFTTQGNGVPFVTGTQPVTAPSEEQPDEGMV